VKSSVGENANIIKIDVDKAASAFQVLGVPTLILFKNSKPLWRKSGIVPAKKWQV
jgi:thioredoxin 1